MGGVNDTPSIGLAASGTGNIVAFSGVNAGTIPVVATITVTPQTAGPACIGIAQTFTITVNPTPTVADPLDQTVCNGALTGAVNFSGTGTSYDWTNSLPSIGLAASGTGNIAAFNGLNAGAVPAVATITVTPKYTFGAVTCTGAVQTFTITVNPLPSVLVADLHDGTGARAYNATNAKFNLSYIANLGVNWLWFQPIHPNGIAGRLTDPDTSQPYEVGS